jgi:type IV pilus modification protein PilV
MEGLMILGALKNNEGGFSLLEAMVAMSILAVGLLGMATLQAVAIRSNGSAMNRTEAVSYVEDLIETYTGTPWDQIPVGTFTDTTNGMTRTTTVEKDVPVNDIKRVTVVVSWRDVTTHNVRFRTLLTKF